eukprot:1915458-Prymnesium_polylepis.2
MVCVWLLGIRCAVLAAAIARPVVAWHAAREPRYGSTVSSGLRQRGTRRGASPDSALTSVSALRSVSDRTWPSVRTSKV